MGNIGKFFHNKIKSPLCRKDSFCGGFFAIEKNLLDGKSLIKFFDSTVATTEIKGNKRNVKIGTKLAFQYKRNIPILDKIVKRIPKDYDDIYVCKHHIGEIYIFCQLLKQYIANNGSKRPLLIIPEKKYISLYEIFCPDVEKLYVNLSMKKLDTQVIDDVIEYKGHRFYIPIPDRFAELRNLIFDKGENVHFYDYIKSKMNISETMGFSPAQISMSTKQRVQEKAKKLGLNLEKFVIFSPEAVTATELSQTFWIKLGEYFAAKGYQIYINTITVSEKYKHKYPNTENWLDKIPNSVKDFAGFDEIYYLAELSKGVLALVNGLVVTFAQIDTPRYFFYTNQTPTLGARMDADTMLNAYRLDYLSGCCKENLYEINLNEMCEKDVIDYIEKNYTDLPVEEVQ